MTPEEKYHRDRWFVLQQIREKELYTPKSKQSLHMGFGNYRVWPKGIQYRLNITPDSKNEECPPSKQISILRQLAEENAIRIVQEENESGYGAYYLFILETIHPKFDEIYQSCEHQQQATSGQTKNNSEIIAEKLNKEFADDKISVWASRAWFEALANDAKPALEKYQQAVAQTLINLEPFRRRLAENAKVISQISQSFTMPSLEAVKPMLKEIEDSLDRVSKFYDLPQKLTITGPLPPKISETIQKNEIISEIKALRKEVEKLTEIKSTVPQHDNLGSVAANKSKPNDSNRAVSGLPFPKLKAGTQWKHFIFRFFQPEETLVKVANGNNIEQKVTYQDLGCEDKRKTIKYPPYDLQWQLLLKLAKNNGEITPTSNAFDKSNEKAKEELTGRLQGYFHIADDPFFPVESSDHQKKKGSYKFRADIFLAEDLLSDGQDGTDQRPKDLITEEVKSHFRGLEGFPEQ